MDLSKLSPEAQTRIAREILAVRSAITPRPWEQQAYSKQLAPDHPRHHLADPVTGVSCGCDTVDDDWKTWVLMTGRGFGKLLCLNTMIPVPSGWKKLREVRIGDEVFDESGRVCHVTGTFDDTPEVAYRLYFSDGSTIDACSDHQWVTWTHRDRKALLRSPYDDSSRFPREWPAWRRKRLCGGSRSGPKVYPNSAGPRVRTTREIADTLTQGKRGDANHCIPACAPLQLPDAELPVDPYLLGYWLGDGTSACAEVTISDDDAEEVLSYLVAAGAARGSERRKEGSSCATYRIGGLRSVNDPADGRFTSSGGLHSRLKKLGALGNKHVPGIYLRASAAQRLALLQGLMDADGGWNGEDSNCVEFSNTKKVLADAVAELAVSLGQKPIVHESRAMLYGRDCGPKWRVWWTPTVNVFRLSRKANRFHAEPGAQSLRNHHRMIIRAERIDPVPMRCLSVDSKHNMYLAGEAMIPTHNTLCGANWAIQVALSEPDIWVGVCAPTFIDIKRVCFEGPSGIEKVAQPGEIADYNKNGLRFTMRNGSVIQGYTADRPDSIRGANLAYCWFDELGSIAKPDFYHFGLLPALRQSKGRLLVTTTPRNVGIISDLIKDAGKPEKRTHYTKATSMENWKSKGVMEMIEKVKSAYGLQSFLGRQELLGELVDDLPGQLFRIQDIDAYRVEAFPELRNTVVAVDPATTANRDSDETGIVVCAEGIDRHFYTLQDCSLKGSVLTVMNAISAAFYRWDASVVVVEKNVAGDWFRQALYDKDPHIPYKPVQAMKGKTIRAQPLSPLMERGLIHMVGRDFDDLERQLISMTSYDDRVHKADDRADAWVWAMRELAGMGKVDWGEVYGFQTCMACGGKVNVRLDKACRSCGVAPDIAEPEPAKDSSVRWSSAYKAKCGEGHEYPMRLKRCPKCHGESEYLENVGRFIGAQGSWHSYTGGNPLLGRTFR